MRLRESLSILSKSSPYAVATDNMGRIDTNLDTFKKYLYINTDVELAISNTLKKLLPSERKIIFLCGSSGDGKSEILTRLKCSYETFVSFHLDATHSFSPHEDAIQTLNRVFDEHAQKSNPLVVGINTGMLGNYSQEGSNERIKSAIARYLETGEQQSDVHFINFEDFPKFVLDDSGLRVKFAEELLEKLTSNTEFNPFYNAYEFTKENNPSLEEQILIANYELLCLPAVQKTLIELLFKVRVYKDQFLTARALLDFIFEMLAGPRYLIDNLFEGVGNEIGQKLADFDPANIRTKSVDRFILAANLGIHEEAFNQFESDVIAQLGIDLANTSNNAQSYLRLFYLLMPESFSNDYHKEFCEAFADEDLSGYIKLYRLHMEAAEDEDRFAVRGFYNKQLRPALRNFNNRSGRKLDKNQYLISEAQGFAIAAKLDIKFDRSKLLEAIERDQNKAPNISHFEAHISVNSNPASILVNANLFKLINKINDGYRPNRHDKNAVILLDELNDDIALIANQSDILQFITDGKTISVEQVDEDEFEVSGL